MDNPEKLATWGTQDEDKQSKHTTQSFLHYYFKYDLHLCVSTFLFKGFRLLDILMFAPVNSKTTDDTSRAGTANPS